MLRITSLGCLGLILLALPLATPPAAAGESVRVELKSGQTLVAEVDARTNARRLWLRFSSGYTEVLRPIVWNHVVRAVVNKEDLDAKTFRARAMKLRSFDHVPKGPAEVVGGTKPSSHPTPGNAGPSTKIESIWAVANLANWDADVGADGLVTEMRPLAAGGQVAPVAGSLQVELWQVHDGRRQKLGRWTRWIEPSHYGPTGVIQRLRLQGDHPEFDPKLSPKGLVHVTFFAPGHGTFKYSVTDVRVRSYSAARDRWHLSSGRRLLPSENIGPAR